MFWDGKVELKEEVIQKNQPKIVKLVIRSDKEK